MGTGEVYTVAARLASKKCKKMYFFHFFEVNQAVFAYFTPDFFPFVCMNGLLGCLLSHERKGGVCKKIPPGTRLMSARGGYDETFT